jgi:hypothetical protein
MLERFQRKHQIVPGEQPSTELLSRFESRLPAYLIAIWKEFGFLTTTDSFLFLTNPDEFEYLKDTGSLSNAAIVILRTSFGDLFTWENNHCDHLMVNDGVISTLDKNIEFFFESTLLMDELLNGVLYWKLHKKAMKRAKRLESDECFAFVPAFALGGSARTSEIETVKLREHLLISGSQRKRLANSLRRTTANIPDHLSSNPVKIFASGVGFSAVSDRVHHH